MLLCVHRTGSIPSWEENIKRKGKEGNHMNLVQVKREVTV